MIVGENDNTAPLDITQRYAAALKERGVNTDVTVLPGRDHEIFLDAAVMQELSKVIAEVRRKASNS
jgi:dipeptidyl aminopeptidase/acylaminoacyl peptidase